jgi:orotidine-5'-phosphate decarboxylase
MKDSELEGLSPLILALDTADLARGIEIAVEVREYVDIVKVGLQLFSAEGPGAVRRVREEGFEVFLDLKLNDIPNTVASACLALCELEPLMLSLHTMGGQEMMRLARRAVGQRCRDPGFRRTLLIGVTVLTSLDLLALKKIGVGHPVEEEVVKLAKLARESGLDGLVASALETLSVRRAVGEELTLITPGVRLASMSKDDQMRVATPGEALRAGADFLVVGRPIHNAEEPRKVAEEILKDAGRR